MSNYLKQKIRIFLLISTILVVFGNAYNYTDTTNFLNYDLTIRQGFNIGALFQYFFSNGIASFAVPAVYTISGFIFFRFYEPTIKEYLNQLKMKTLRTLLAYAIWSLLSLFIMYLCIDVFPSFNKLPFIQEHMQYIDAIGPLGYFMVTPNFQFSVFLGLQILFIYSPLIYLLLKYLKGIILLPLAVLWLVQFNLPINIDALLFFMAGAYISLYINDEVHYSAPIEKRTFQWAVVIWLILNIAKTYWAATVDLNNDVVGEIGLLVMHNISIVLGMIVVWYLVDYIIPKFSLCKRILKFSKYSVFIFMFHEPFLHLCTQFALRSDTPSDLSHMIIYFGVPISIIAIAAVVDMLLLKFAPPVHNVLTANIDKTLFYLPKKEQTKENN